ncbi:MAG: helix-turn-helix transcriptional regulator, partial [Raoultibacter sp.]
MALFTSNIRRYRQACGMTQEDLANKVGARRETIVRLENAKYNPSLELAARISSVLKQPIEV